MLMQGKQSSQEKVEQKSSPFSHFKQGFNCTTMKQISGAYWIWIIQNKNYEFVLFIASLEFEKAIFGYYDVVA